MCYLIMRYLYGAYRYLLILRRLAWGFGVHKDNKAIESVMPAKRGNVAPPVIDLGSDPYFVKKVESAKRLLDKYGVCLKDDQNICIEI